MNNLITESSTRGVPYDITCNNVVCQNLDVLGTFTGGTLIQTTGSFQSLSAVTGSIYNLTTNNLALNSINATGAQIGNLVYALATGGFLVSTGSVSASPTNGFFQVYGDIPSDQINTGSTATVNSYIGRITVNNNHSINAGSSTVITVNNNMCDQLGYNLCHAWVERSNNVTSGAVLLVTDVVSVGSPMQITVNNVGSTGSGGGSNYYILGFNMWRPLGR